MPGAPEAAENRQEEQSHQREPRKGHHEQIHGDDALLPREMMMEVRQDLQRKMRKMRAQKNADANTMCIF